MQEEGAFPPLGGCLPMFLQIPVFIGLFAALRSFSTCAKRRSPSGSTTSRCRPVPPDRAPPAADRRDRVPERPAAPDGRALDLAAEGHADARRRAGRGCRKMMMWMPVMMGFFLYNYAAGLSLYMITQSGLGIIEQKVIKKVWPLDDTEKPKKKAASWRASWSSSNSSSSRRKKKRRGANQRRT
jgi:YidC/Oxa1 family membrane protein insertase